MSLHREAIWQLHKTWQKNYMYYQEKLLLLANKMNLGTFFFTHT